MPPRQHKRQLSLADKLQVLDNLRGAMTRNRVAQIYGVDPTRISRLKGNGEKLRLPFFDSVEMGRKQQHKPEGENAKKTRLTLFFQRQCKHVPVHGPMTFEKATQHILNLNLYPLPRGFNESKEKQH